MNISEFWTINKINSPKEDRKFLEKIWNDLIIPKTKYWQTQIFEHIGKDGTTKLLYDNNVYNHLGYKDFIGKTRHLDVGSGTGYTSLYIHKNNNVPVEMTDVYCDDLSDDVKNSLGNGFNFTLYKAGDGLPFGNDSFDSASLFYVLHHCENRSVSSRLLKEIYRVLKDNSYLVVIDEPVASDTEREITDALDLIINSYYASSGFNQNKGFDIANFYAKEELEDQFIANGFNIIKCIEDIKWNWLLKRSLYILKK